MPSKIRILLICALLLSPAIAGAVDLGTLITTENALFPIVCLDDTGHVRIDIDSFIVEVTKHDGGETSGDLVVDYSARGDTTAAWVTRSVYAGDTIWWFRDAVADIDGGAGNGQYTGVVKAYKGGQPTVNPFSFYLTTTSFTTLIERLDAAMTTRLAPTTAGRTLDVTAAGEAGLDLDNTSGTLSAAEIGTGAIVWGVELDTAGFGANVQEAARDGVVQYDPPTNAEMEARTIAAANYFDPAADSVFADKSSLGDLNIRVASDDTIAVVTTVGTVTNGVNATSVSGSSAAADSAESLFLRATKSFDVGSIYGDTSAANNLDMAFDNVIDSSVVLDLRGLSIIGNYDDPHAFAFRVRNHGAGHGFHVLTDTASSEGVMFQTTGAAADALVLRASGAGADALQTNASGTGSVYDWHAVGSTGFLINGDVGVAGGLGVSIDNGLTVAGAVEFGTIVLNGSLGVADFAADYKDMLSDSTRKALGDTLTAFMFEVLDSLHSQGWAATSASSLDSVVVWRLFRRAFGLDVASGDTLTVAQRTVTDVSGVGGGSCGSGSQTVTLCVQDTSGTDEFVAQAHVSLYTDAARTSLYADPFTQTGGCQIANLDASTTYYYSITRAGFTFDTNNFTTGSGGTWGDTLFGYNVVVGSSGSASLCRVYGYVSDGPNAIRNAEVTLTLENISAGKVVIDTAADRMVAVRTFTARTDANGYFYIDVVPNLYLTPAKTTYRYTASKPGVTSPIIEKSGIEVPTDATARIEDLF